MIDLRRFVTSLVTVSVLLAVAWGWWSLRLAAERSDAVKDATIATLRRSVDSLGPLSDSLRKVYRRDTVVLFKRADHWDSVNVLTGQLDSARAALARVAQVPAAKPETVTVRVTAASVVEADVTIKQCRVTVRECGERASTAETRAAKADSALKLALQPSPFIKRVTPLAIAGGVGALLCALFCR